MPARQRNRAEDRQRTPAIAIMLEPQSSPAFLGLVHRSGGQGGAMDAEIWSYADTRNGRLILRALTVLILLKEIAVMALPLFGLPVVDPVWEPPAAPGTLESVKGPLTLLIKFLLVLCLHIGFSWSRIGLALVYLVSCAYGLGITLKAPMEATGLGPMLTLANGLLGAVIAAVLLLSAQLKAHLWRKAATRLIIPIPGEDEPAERPARRTHTLGETVVIALQRLVSLAIILGVLGVIAHLYGLTGLLLEMFGR